MQNKILSVMMAAAMTVSMTACGGDTASDNTSASADNSAAATESAATGSTDGQKYTIGILQQLEHPALDAASQGFEDALTEEGILHRLHEEKTLFFPGESSFCLSGRNPPVHVPF